MIQKLAPRPIRGEGCEAEDVTLGCHTSGEAEVRFVNSRADSRDFHFYLLLFYPKCIII